MRRALLAAALAAATALSGSVATADENEQRLPVQDPGVAGKLVAINDCTAESEYDTPNYYGDKCRRLRVVFGPIVVNPGKNDVQIQPVTFEKPMWDGYMTRFKPGLFSASGSTPPVEDLHLHHGTWLNPGYFGGGGDNIGPLPNPSRSYGWGPWLATGEEKTIVFNPYRYGLKIKGSDAWLFLHMVHSAVATPTVVWVSYDIDYVAAEDAEEIQADGKPLITNTKGIWLDVGGGGNWSDGKPNDDTFPANPVYNVNAGFGQSSEGTINEYKLPAEEAEIYGLGDGSSETAIRVCGWPDENCARENSEGKESRNQGNDVGAAVEGWEREVTAEMAGTLVVMGGHLHMGGINDTVSLVREYELPDGSKKKFAKPIHVSDGYYWNWEDGSKVGAPPISWDVSMTGVSADIGWKVEIRKGDKIRLNAIYDSDIASWLENMGIVMTWVAPGDTSGIDPFRGCEATSAGTLTRCQVEIKNGLLPAKFAPGEARLPVPADNPSFPGSTVAAGDYSVARPEAAPGWELPGQNLEICNPGPNTLCTRGQVTHPHVPSANNSRGGCRGAGCSDALLETARAAGPGEFIDEIHMAGFVYSAGDFGTIGLTGIPRVRLGDSITFYNEDMAMAVPHTATACRYPCTGPVKINYPIPDAAVPVSPTPDLSDDPSFTVEDPNGSKALDTMDFDTTQLGYHIGAAQRATYELKATRTGLYTYFCRIHPFMRGVFEVVPADAE